MKHAAVTWLAVAALSLAAGGAVGLVLLWIWYFIGVFFLGFGDSGPAWANVVSDVVFIMGLALSLAGGQWVYFRKVRRHAGSATSAPPR